MPAADLDLLRDAAEEAGRIAQRYSGKTARRWDKPGGAGPVTEADIAVNEMLERRLRAARPGYGWLSEESPDDGSRLEHETVFIVDPIDGTRSFTEGGRTWAHALAVVERGEVTAGVVYLPRREMLFAAARGEGATLNREPIRPSSREDLEGAYVLATRPNMEPQHWAGGHVPRIERAHRPSLAYRLALVAQGRFDAMLTLRPCWEWDVAAGALILQEAGARCTDRRGGPLRFNNAHPTVQGLVAGNDTLHDAVLGALQSA